MKRSPLRDSIAIPGGWNSSLLPVQYIEYCGGSFEVGGSCRVVIDSSPAAVRLTPGGAIGGSASSIRTTSVDEDRTQRW